MLERVGTTLTAINATSLSLSLFFNVLNKQLLKDAFRIKTERVTELMHQAKRLAEVYISRGRDSSTTVDIRVRVFCAFVCDPRDLPYALCSRFTYPLCIFCVCTS